MNSSAIENGHKKSLKFEIVRKGGGMEKSIQFLVVVMLLMSIWISIGISCLLVITIVPLPMFCIYLYWAFVLDRDSPYNGRRAKRFGDI